MNKIGYQIRKLRTSLSITQAQLATELGVQYQTVSKWETGTTVPDTQMLPLIADYFHISIDELMGHTQRGCTGSISEDEKIFLLETYSQMYGPEAGPWNLSVANKYLEYRFTSFFEENFTITHGSNICNIGIGAGEWDRYLSYQLHGGTLTSIDKLENCCRQLEKRLQIEQNPNHVQIICADAMTLQFKESFDIVTMVGSTLMESNTGLALLEHVFTFLKPGGSIYYQTLDENEDCSQVIKTAFRNHLRMQAYLEDKAYGFHCHYYKFVKYSL